MIKLFLLSTLLVLNLFSNEIPLEHTISKAFSKSIKLNGQIIQLSNASQSIMSQVGGQVQKYFVKAGQKVKKGQKVVLIKSILLSKMTAEFISLQKQLVAQEKNYTAQKNLYEKGMTSLVNINAQSIKNNELLSKSTALKSQLQTLGINTDKLNKATSNFMIYAHSNGIVASILQPLHSSVKEDTPIISLVKEQAFYLKSYLPLKYASKVKVSQKIVIQNGDDTIISYVTQILPKVDEKTQRIVILSSIDAPNIKLYINAYTDATLYFSESKKHVAVKTTALSFFNNEWVVFTPEKHDEHEEAKEHEDEEAEYEVRVVKIITQDEKYTAIEGLKLDEEYVSAKSYYVKSLLLKSSLGGHGH
ncbi:efflux RND transporter periplasmic adaptor subunit [Sulfurimonas sp.]|uniref:efflux RND transporter periplasmic adaptor subunit n=1 Tax=Sulfurimonas sp. TaxID=2022749 RepID=UPI002B477A5A|nr:efflux RND transporter periplasmic adaptor subunit [Sulfurimonas sp.]